MTHPRMITKTRKARKRQNFNVPYSRCGADAFKLQYYCKELEAILPNNEDKKCSCILKCPKTPTKGSEDDETNQPT